MNAASTPGRILAWWLVQLVTPFTPKPRCPHGCEFKTRDGREMAAHVYVEHAGDEKVGRHA